MTANKTPASVISQLQKLFSEHFGNPPENVALLPVSGSDRRYYRLSSSHHSAIGTYNPNVAENNTYFYFAELFRKHGVPVAEIYKIGKGRKCYLQQDLGDITLFQELTDKGKTPEVRAHFHQALAELAKAQWLAGREANFDQCFSTRNFDEHAIMMDLYYFKYYFADLQPIHYDKKLLVEEMEQFSRELGRAQPQTLMYRDFQSRNVMLHEGQTYLIDFQGAMQGAPQYDVASFLWQAKAQLPPDWKEDLLNGYISTLNSLPIPRMEEILFRRTYAQFVLLRLLQVLGAYGFRGLLQRKPHFLTSIAPALQSLEDFLEAYPQIPSSPEFRSALEKLTAKNVRQLYVSMAPVNARLQITIKSFSYKKGIPEDKTDHGGGFVFDCRGLLNPGRFDAYKHLNGRDAEVQEFLRQESRMPEFLEHIYALISINIEDYLHRGFEHLSLSFGCTGGQHRSVFAAEQVAAFISDRYHIPVSVTHLNEKNWIKK